MDPRDVGAVGERLAAALLCRHGARVVGRNLRSGRDELDLVVEIEGDTVLVEVKTRRTSEFSPDLNFDERKATALRRAAHHLGMRVSRVDLVTVELDETGAALRWIPAVG